MTDANQLLSDYARNGSDDAFRELVSRYMDLVYSVAVRQVNGDADLARDVVQTVFTDLARKASRLRAESSLGGWLHRHTCFVSSNARRSERRRMVREQMALEMNNEPSDSAWDRLAPVLDEAIDELNDAERKAIVLRFYERRDLRSVGLAFGTNEDAAQKRVSRALDKLRAVLEARGVTLAAGVLATLLTGRAVSAAPAGLATEVGTSALTAAGGSGFLATLMGIMTAINVKLVIGLAVAGLAAGALVYNTVGTHNGAPPTQRALKTGGAGSPAATTADAAASTGGATAIADTKSDAALNGEAAPTAEGLRLTIIAADSGQPVPGVQVHYRGWEKEKFNRNQFVANRSGICNVAVPRGTITQLELTSVAEGFADARLEWRTDRGEVIPPDYTLRLTRPVRISGRVVDADGQPIARAKMGWNHQEDGAADTRPESHAFGWIEVETDSDGRWQVNRIAADMIRRLYGSPRHPDHVSPPLLMVSENRPVELQLRDGTHVFHMSRAFSVSGTVYDPDGKPVEDASVHAGGVGSSDRRESRSGPGGSFVVSGCAPGKNLITAEATGFTAATVEVEVATNTAPVSIKLQRGRVLRLRLVDKAAQPIPGAWVWYNTMRNGPVNFDKPTPPPPVQVEFNPKTDAEGRAVWDAAPEGELTFSFHKPGFMRRDDVKVEADGQEHVITLSPALVVSGTVVDASTGKPIPKFRVACGWPSTDIDGQTVPRFSNIERFWLNFADGKFRHAFEEWLVGGMKSNPGYILKFEAEGYAPFVSRTIKEEEGEVTLEVKLNPAGLLVVTVQLPDGRPAADLEVGLIAPGVDLRLGPLGFSRWNSQATGNLLVTDARGQVKMPPDDQVVQVVAAGAAGFAQATPAELQTNPTLRLQPWGRIEGVFASGRRAADRKMMLGPSKPGAVALQFDFQSYQVTADADGRFTFAQVPPGTWKLIHLLPLKQPSGGMAWMHQPVQDVEVRPGETTSITVGAGTRSVVGRVRFPAGFERPVGQSLFASIHTSFPKPPVEIKDDRAAMEKWMQSAEVRALAAKARGYPMKENADGSWSADEVQPGEYVVTAGVMPSQPNPGVPPTVAAAAITVPEGTEVLDLGELALQRTE